MRLVGVERARVRRIEVRLLFTLDYYFLFFFLFSFCWMALLNTQHNFINCSLLYLLIFSWR